MGPTGGKSEPASGVPAGHFVRPLHGAKASGPAVALTTPGVWVVGRMQFLVQSVVGGNDLSDHHAHGENRPMLVVHCKAGMARASSQMHLALRGT